MTKTTPKDLRTLVCLASCPNDISPPTVEEWLAEMYVLCNSYPDFKPVVDAAASILDNATRSGRATIKTPWNNMLVILWYTPLKLRRMEVSYIS